MPAGRPTKLTAAVQSAIVAALNIGSYRVTAAQAAGISERTLYSWLDLGAKGEEPYAELLQAVKTSESKAELDLLLEIRTAQTGDKDSRADVWQARAWVMERRWPKRWATRVRTAVTEELDAFTDRLQRRLDDDTYRKVMDASREDAGGEGASEAKH